MHLISTAKNTSQDNNCRATSNRRIEEIQYYYESTPTCRPACLPACNRTMHARSFIVRCNGCHTVLMMTTSVSRIIVVVSVVAGVKEPELLNSFCELRSQFVVVFFTDLLWFGLFCNLMFGIVNDSWVCCCCCLHVTVLQDDGRKPLINIEDHTFSG